MRYLSLCLLLVAVFSATVLTTPLSAGDLTISADTQWSSGTYYFDTLTINAILLCKGNTTYNIGVIISCTNLIVGANGRLSADSQGYPGGQGPGVGLGFFGGGGYGGHGGGGYQTSLGGAQYGSITNPTDLGSGSAQPAGGGGAITLYVANELRVDSTISSDGGVRYAGGSGGSIYIRTKILSGAGNITANGGTQNSSQYADGGGGRIAIFYETNSFIGTILCRRGAGGTGAATCGTIFMKSPAQPNGDLIIDAGGYANGAGAYANVYFQALTGSYTFDTIVVKNLGHFEINSLSNITATTFVSDTSANILRYTGGTFSVSQGTLPNGDFIIDTMIMELTTNKASFGNLLIRPNGRLTHLANYDGQKRYWIDMTVNNNLTIDSGGAIDVSGKGYPAGAGPGAGLNSYYGGSYGGKGGMSLSGISASTYGSATEPVELGSGGNAGPGGGAVKILVWGTLTLNGVIRADGPFVGHGNGSGGSVYIKTPSFTGNSSGRISVKGGSNAGYYGSGGGGRIAVHYTSYLFNGTYDTSGGVGIDIGCSGTVYLNQRIFHIVPDTPSIDNPSYPSPIQGRRPTFRWSAPTDDEEDTLNFQIQISQDSSFASVTVDASSDVSQSGFEYSSDNGLTWQNYPSSGIESNASPALKVSYTAQTDLSVGTWYWRVRAKDRDGNSGWSELGYLPSITGNLILKINSPSDSTSTYSETITVQGLIDQSVSQTISVNDNSYNLALTNGTFSTIVSLSIGTNVITVTGNGPLGNYISDSVVVYRIKVRASSASASIGQSGGTVRLDDWDNDADNDARIEFLPGTFDNETPVKLSLVSSDVAVYELTVNNRQSYSFKKKVRLVLSYSMLKTNAEDEKYLKICYWDGVKWQTVGGTVDTDKKTVSCYTSHASRYAVIKVADGIENSATASPDIITPNHDGVNDAVVFNVRATDNAKAVINIYDMTGKIVRVIAEEDFGSSMSLAWDGTDAEGKLTETGLYVFSVTLSGRIISTGSVVIAR